MYLLGYEFPSTLMLMSKTKVTFIVSTSKGSSHSNPLSPRTGLTHLCSQSSISHPCSHLLHPWRRRAVSRSRFWNERRTRLTTNLFSFKSSSESVLVYVPLPPILEIVTDLV